MALGGKAAAYAILANSESWGNLAKFEAKC